MTVATSLTYDIRLVAEVVPADGGLEIRFRGGASAFLDASHPNFAVARITVESRCGRTMAVGVILDAEHRLVDLNAAHDTTVSFIQEDPEDPTRFRVGFWGYSPLCYLTRDHPEFERIHSLLASAAGSARTVWVANHSEMVLTEPQGDVEGECWWKIMDVRLA